MNHEPYRQFARAFADSTPIRSERELEAAIAAAGLREDEVTRAFLDSLRRTWVYGESDVPFKNETLNRRYIRMLFE